MKLSPAALAIASAVAVWAQPSNAALVYQSVVSGQGISASVAFDTVTALQWLSPVATRGLTIESVVDGAGGWATDGFRYATMAEFRAMLNNAGVMAVGIDPTQAERWYDSSTVSAAQDLLLGLGWTYQNNPPSPGSPFGQREFYGIVSDIYVGDGQTPPSRQFAWVGATDTFAYAYVAGAQWKYGSQDSLVGSLLVREAANSVPEPSTLTLVLPVLVAALRLVARSDG